MKIRRKVVIEVDDGDADSTIGRVHLREPNAEEWNTFQAESVQISRGPTVEVTNNANEARVNLFDRLVEAFEDIEDEDGAITVERKDAFPARLKAEGILKAFETATSINVKN